MTNLTQLEILFVIIALLFQVILTLHFAVRRWRLELAVRWGPVIYALSIPASLASVALLLDGMAWYFWLAGFLYLAWAAFGYTLEYIQKNHQWRTPFQWQVGVPYVSLYLATVMFYWWPLVRISMPLWYAYTFLYLVSSILNVTSHKAQRGNRAVLQYNIGGKKP